MPRNTGQNQPRQAQLSFAEMQEAIPKIDRRIRDLEDFDVNGVNERSDPRIKTLEQRLDTLLASIFSVDTVEYQRYWRDITKINTAPTPGLRNPPSIQNVREGLQRGVATAKATLESLKEGFLETLRDAGQTAAGKTLKAYEGLELHPAIERAAGGLFQNGHYANAVEDAVKALNALVRLNSGIHDKDGTQLMEFVFSAKAPILKFNSVADQSDIDEQRGFMMMFSGAVAGLRNPRAHKIIKDSPEKALEFIAFISLLAKLADGATK